MSLDNFSREEIERMSLLRLAKEVLVEEKKALDFRDIFNKVAELKGLTEAQKEALLAQFYTDLNVDGGFITLGANMWGLKRWYPVEQMDEEIQNEPKKKKKTKKKRVEEEEDLDVDEEDTDLDSDDEEMDDDFIDLDDDDDDEDDDFEDIDDEDFDEFDDDDEDLEDDDINDLDDSDDDESDEDFEDEK